MSHDAGSRRGLLWSGDGWSPRETREYLQNDRDWQAVQHFYRRVVQGTASLRDLGLRCAEEIHLGERWSERIARFEESLECQDDGGSSYGRSTYRMYLSYFGGDFDGWAFNSTLQTVSGKVVEVIKGELGAERMVLSSAGRTDKGVTACGQAVSFFTWKEFSKQKLIDALNRAAPNGLRVWWIEAVPRSFHATFSAKWRRYVYLLPMNSATTADSSTHGREAIDIARVRLLLESLVGKRLDYYAFARDTSKKQTFECTIHRTSVFTTDIKNCKEASSGEAGICTSCLCIEICADRFLRRMARVLVATVIHESVAEGSSYGGNDDDALLKMVAERNRQKTAPAAPVEGLCLAGVGYDKS